MLIIFAMAPLWTAIIRPKLVANFGARYNTVIVPNVANNSHKPVAKA